MPGHSWKILCPGIYKGVRSKCETITQWRYSDFPQPLAAP